MTNFFAIFELYCPALETFFTLVDELRLALHNMWEISNLPMGLMPYKEYSPLTMAPEQMEKDDSEIFETNQEFSVPLLHLHGRL